MCAHAVRVALQKLAGVESVDVSLERAVVDMRLRVPNAVTLAQVRDIVRKNGFGSREATVTVEGMLVNRSGQPAIEVSGTGVTMRIVPDTASPDAFRQVQSGLAAGALRTVELVGTVTLTAGQQEQVAVRSLRPR